ncbi:MAG: hypothetical protein IH945_03250 [Armatimonadetes bacterium]|nr:hypothetical protein [Armatimonadota bacterium]
MVDWDSLDMSMAPEGYAELRTAVVRVELPGMAYFRLAGADCVGWLQGQATNDVADLDGGPVDFCLTKPTGQILALCRVWSHEGAMLVATAEPEVLVSRVEQTVFIEDVVLERIENQAVCLQGPLAKSDGTALPSDRTGSGGSEVFAAAEAPLISPEGFDLATLEAGVPHLGVDTTDKTLPPELGPAFEAAHVSYAKGCYTGQEVLMRIRARGHTNKTWVGLKLEGAAKQGDQVEFESKAVGKIQRTAVSPAFGCIASATLRTAAVEPGTQVAVGGAPATVVEMPFLR